MRISFPLTAAVGTASVLLSGCCLKSLTVKPSVTFTGGTIGTGSADVSMDFKECCPTKEQKELALNVQRKLAKSYDELASKPHPTKEDVEAFNRKQKAAADAIRNVILVCNAAKEAEKEPNKTAPSARPRATQADVDRAWARLAGVERGL